MYVTFDSIDKRVKDFVWETNAWSAVFWRDSENDLFESDSNYCVNKVDANKYQAFFKGNGT